MYNSDFLTIIRSYGLNKLLGYFIQYNGKSNFNPYHNSYHAQCVVVNAYKCIYPYPRIKVDEFEAKAILVAALFHDFRHTGKKDSESNNIELACDGLFHYGLKVGLSLDTIYFAQSLIKSTKWPYEKNGSELSLCEEILRDADMLQCLDTNYIQQTLLGLMTEWGISYQDALEAQANYLKNVKFLTQYGISRQDETQSVLELLQLLKENGI